MASHDLDQYRATLHFFLFVHEGLFEHRLAPFLNFHQGEKVSETNLSTFICIRGNLTRSMAGDLGW